MYNYAAARAKCCCLIHYAGALGMFAGLASCSLLAAVTSEEELAALRSEVAGLRARLTQNTAIRHAASATTSVHEETVAALHTRLKSLLVAIANSSQLLLSYYAEDGDSHAAGKVLEQSYALHTGEAHRKGIEFLAHKAARALVWRDRFVVGAMGSSVTAGHDNCHSDSYEAQLERLMAPVWAAGGAELEVRNAGQGGGCGDSYANQVPCMRQILGDDVDEIHYCWTYFENPSHRSSMIAMYHEAFVRWGLLMERSPAALILEADSGIEPTLDGKQACEPIKDVLEYARCRRTLLRNQSGPECGTESDAELLKAYGPLGANVLCMTNGLVKRGYRGKVWQAVGDTLHNTTREGEQQENKERRQSLGVVWRNWHPGPLLFQTVADVIAHRHLVALKVAIGMIKAEANPWARWPRRPKLLVRTRDLPAPVSHSFAGWLDLDEPPGCAYYELPSYGKAQVYIQDEEAAASDWEHDQSPTSMLVPREETDLPGCAHADACAGYVMATALRPVAPRSPLKVRRSDVPPPPLPPLPPEDLVRAGAIARATADRSYIRPLSFMLPRMKVGFISVCCDIPSHFHPEKGQSDCVTLLVEGGALFTFDAASVEPLSRPKSHRPQGSKCVVLQERFSSPVHSAGGHLMISVALPRTLHMVRLTHVIAF